MVDPRYEIGTGAALVTSPLWTHWLNIVHDGASLIAVICGAILGVAGVIRLVARCWRDRHGGK